MTTAEFVVDGIFFPEGLVWLPDDQTLFVSSVQEGVLYKVWPLEHRKEAFGDLGGGANNVALATKGGALVTQNGGLNAYPGILRSFPDVGPWPEIRPTQPGIVYLAAQNESRYLVSEEVDTPNDLVVARDNTVYFTDPGNPFSGQPRDARVRALSKGEVRTVASGFDYCNGIEIENDDTLLVTDHGGVRRVTLDGDVTWVAQGIGNPSPDGITVDVEGRMYVAASRDSGVQVLENGESVDFLSVPGEGSTSNCIFGGPDYRWLFATDTRNGRVMMFTDMPTPGRSANAWQPDF